MSGVFTKDITRALRFAKNLDTGVVGVNCVSYMNMQVSRSRIVEILVANKIFANNSIGAIWRQKTIGKSILAVSTEAEFVSLAKPRPSRSIHFCIGSVLTLLFFQGIGREFGEYALRAYTEPKTILIK